MVVTENGVGFCDFARMKRRGNSFEDLATCLLEPVATTLDANSSVALQFFDLSHPWGHNAPLWPYFPDVKIERFHYHAKSGVLSQQITTFMHCTTHTDAPAHVIEGTPYIDELPLASYFGTGVVVSIPIEKWEVITAEDHNVGPVSRALRPCPASASAKSCSRRP